MRVAVVIYVLGFLAAFWLIFGNDVSRSLKGFQTLNFSWTGIGLLAAPTIAGAITVFYVRQYLSKEHYKEVMM